MKEIIQRYTLKHDKKIKQICAPLVECLNIPIFTYFRISTSGQLITIGNFPAQLEFYYDEQLYLSNPYFVDPQLLHSGCVLTEQTSDPAYLKTIHRSKMHFNMYHTFLVIEKCGDAIEGFFFGTQSANPHVSFTYLNQVELLKKFSRYFVRETTPLLKKIESDGFNIKELKGNSFTERSPDLPLSSQNAKVKNFLNFLSPLSKRERECLELFRSGHSAQATAARLHISSRTVEHYFDTIKEKLGCSSKWDLLHLG